MCGGTIEFEEGATVGECQHCGTKQTLPKLDDDRKTNLYDRANHFRRNNDYDKAAGIYEQILNEDPSDAEAYWSLVICQYGIEYVEDPATHKRVPTVNRAQFTSIFDDDNYKSALQYSDTLQRTIYEQEANAINEIQKCILSISQKEDPFDVFICYKETDANGRRTQDSVLANDLYHQLTQEGFKVFFARITLEDKLGTAYEPYIFAALNSAKVMVVLGTKPEYFNAVWVKNEWSRYLGLVKNSNGKKILIPAYKDMDPYDLPEEFSHLQAQDMSKLGFMQDLIRGIKKITYLNDKQQNSIDNKTINSQDMSIKASTETLLKRVFIFLEDGNWDDADIYCEKVLDLDPENAKAYFGKMLANLKVHCEEDLESSKIDFEDNENYRKIKKYGDKDFVTKIENYLNSIQSQMKYEAAISAMGKASTEDDFSLAAQMFNSLIGYKDSELCYNECLRKGEEIRKKAAEEEQNKEYVDNIFHDIKSKLKNRLEELFLFKAVYDDYTEKKKISKVEADTCRKYKEALKSLNEYLNNVNRLWEIRKQITQLQAESNNLGLFDIGKKKKINNSLDNLSDEISQILKTNENIRNAQLYGFSDINIPLGADDPEYFMNIIEDVKKKISEYEKNANVDCPLLDSLYRKYLEEGFLDTISNMDIKKVGNIEKYRAAGEFFSEGKIVHAYILYKDANYADSNEKVVELETGNNDLKDKYMMYKRLNPYNH